LLKNYTNKLTRINIIMENFTWGNTIVTHMHIELSNYCNAACPFCPRYTLGSKKVRPDLLLQQITYDQFKDWFKPNFMKNIYRILFCGNYGDPVTCKDLLKICQYILDEAPKCDIKINTNGGLRNKNFWQSLGMLFQQSQNNHEVTFSIDGLEDTNHLYRRNVKWNKLMENVNAFIGTGASAKWEYLIFAHNEHQIEQAESLSKKLKFKNFVKKRALGFEKPGGGLLSRPVYDENGKFEYVIDPPNKKEYINSFTFDKLKNIKQDIDLSRFDLWSTNKNIDVEQDLENFDVSKVAPEFSYVKEYEKFEVNCKSCRNDEKNISEIFISVDGTVYPCCYIGARYQSIKSNFENNQLRYKIREFGKEKFNLKYSSIENILENEYLDKLYSSSWYKPTIEDGKIIYCAMTCGNKSMVDKIYKI